MTEQAQKGLHRAGEQPGEIPSMDIGSPLPSACPGRHLSPQGDNTLQVIPSLQPCSWSCIQSA